MVRAHTSPPFRQGPQSGGKSTPDAPQLRKAAPQSLPGRRSKTTAAKSVHNQLSMPLLFFGLLKEKGESWVLTGIDWNCSSWVGGLW